MESIYLLLYNWDRLSLVIFAWLNGGLNWNVSYACLWLISQNLKFIHDLEFFLQVQVVSRRVALSQIRKAVRFWRNKRSCSTLWRCSMKLPVLQPTRIGVWDWVLGLSSILDSNIFHCMTFRVSGTSHCRDRPKNNYFLWRSNRRVDFCIYEYRGWKLHKMRNVLLNSVQYECDRCSAQYRGTQCIKGVYW